MAPRSSSTCDSRLSCSPALQNLSSMPLRPPICALACRPSISVWSRTAPWSWRMTTSGRNATRSALAATVQIQLSANQPGYPSGVSCPTVSTHSRDTNSVSGRLRPVLSSGYTSSNLSGVCLNASSICSSHPGVSMTLSSPMRPTMSPLAMLNALFHSSEEQRTPLSENGRGPLPYLIRWRIGYWLRLRSSSSSHAHTSKAPCAVAAAERNSWSSICGRPRVGTSRLITAAPPAT